MKALLEESGERSADIETLLNMAREKRPTYYDMVVEFPTPKLVKNLLRDIMDDEKTTMLVYAYLTNK
jgi:hypothetical protein